MTKPGQAFAAVALLAALLLSGCTAGNSGGAATESAGTDPDKGVLAGVVVDDAVRPIAGANVTAAGTAGLLNATTDEEGQFRIADLEPGLYIVEVSKPFYSPHQQAVDVRAGVEPPLTKFQLALEQSSLPFVNQYKFEGFFECGVWPTNGCANINIITGIMLCSLDLPCFNATSDRSVELIPIDGVPTFLQSEMVWEPTTPTGQDLQFGLGGATRQELQDGFADGYNFTEGVSPLMLTLDNGTLIESGIGGPEGRMLLIQVSGSVTHKIPGGCPEVSDPCGVGLVVQQPYTTYTHAFHGFLPPPGWLFTATGQPPPPPT